MLKIGVLILSLLLCVSCSDASTMKTPTTRLNESETPEFIDDLEFAGIETAMERQLQAYDRRPLIGKIIFGTDAYDMSVLKETILLFRDIVKIRKTCVDDRDICDQILKNEIKKSFNVYVPSLNPVRFTAYYSPILSGSKVQTEIYKYPIYSLPVSTKLRSLSRIEIDFDHKLAGNNLELFYVKNLFDLYLLHVEGGGAVSLQDGTVHNLSYSGSNKKVFKFISNYMFDTGLITDKSLKSQREYIESNPDQWKSIYSYCPGYVFFQESKSAPLGLEDIPLTDNRTLAQDKMFYPRKGILAFVKASRPLENKSSRDARDGAVNGAGEVEMMDYSRFYIDQDTGGAIQGEARADLYFGFGQYAELASNSMDVYGQMFFLVKKK